MSLSFLKWFIGQSLSDGDMTRIYIKSRAEYLIICSILEVSGYTTTAFDVEIEDGTIQGIDTNMLYSQFLAIIDS